MDHGEMAKLRDWVGRTQSVRDVITAVPADLLAASLDRDDPPYREGDALPPNWHRLYFLSAARPGDVGEDGHPARGLFLPPVPLPRRMFAGGRIVWHRPLRVGDAVTRVSEITQVEGKEGRSGHLVFVTMRQRFLIGDTPAMEETQDIVYREAASASSAAASAVPAVETAPWQREIRPDPVLLFRYSALTFNGHRIHYDHPYVTQVEGYPERIVHGPLIATFLLDLVRREAPHARVVAFSFRAQRPLFCGAPFTVRGWPSADRRSVRLAAVDGGGATAMSADADLAP
jgi:3-methylfumaryl-CoA hydratase